MTIGIDPGTEQSAVVVWDCKTIRVALILPNAAMLDWVKTAAGEGLHELYIEMIASYGMPVGRDVFETVWWIGRFCEAWERVSGRSANRVYRKQITLHHCNAAKAKDSNIRQALIDKYGAPGTKKAPGLTYGLHADLWSAFAIATYATEGGDAS